MGSLPALLFRRPLVALVVGLAGLALFGGMISRLAAFAPLLAGLAVLVIVVWTFVGSGGQIGSSGANAASLGARSTASRPFKRGSGKPIEPATMAVQLREGVPIGLSTSLAMEIVQSLHAFQLSGAPPKPYSLLLVAEEDWVLQEFARRFCAGLGTDIGRVPVVECTTLTELSLKELSNALRAAPVPVLVLNALERLRQHGSPARVTAPLEVVLQGRERGWNGTMILMLETITPADSRLLADPNPVRLDQRPRLRAALRSISALPIAEIGTVDSLAPLSEVERVVVIWEEFCTTAATEYQVTVANAATLDRAPAEDRMLDFLDLALSTWNEHGVRAARDFVRLSSQAALAGARAAGVNRVVPYWLSDRQLLQLRPAGQNM